MADEDDLVPGEEEAPGDEYVVCARCGARIKATRERCLRCFEPLHVDESKLPVWRTQRISDQTGVIVGALALAAVGGLVWVLYSTADNSTADTEAKPAGHNALSNVKPPQQRGLPTNPADANGQPADASADASADAPAAGQAPSAAPFAPSANDLAATRRAFEEKLKTNPNDPVALDGLGLAQVRVNRIRVRVEIRRQCA